MNYYTVYVKRTDEIVAVGTAKECAKQMKRSLASFYCTVNRNRNGKHHKYEIISEPLDLEDEDSGQ